MDKKVTIWDQIEEGHTVERKEESESACGVHYWILAYPDGTRKLKPYRCGTCSDCKYRDGIEMKVRLYSLAFLNNIKFVKAPPSVVSNIVKKIATKDYVRFPSEDGFDYLFSASDIGVDFFSADPDWRAIMSRRSGTRKTGKLITFKEEKPDLTMPLRDIRAISYDIALSALEYAKSIFGTDEEKEIVNETDLITTNNIITASILDKLYEENAVFFDHVVNRGYTLPVKFKFNIETAKE